MEADTRYIINNNLRNKGWILDASNPKCNVHFESPKDKKLRRKLKGKHPDYILYQSGTKKPIGIIEAKKVGIDLKKALSQGEEYAKRLEAPLIFAMNGAYCETRWLGNKKSLILNGEEVKEIIREKEALKFLEENSNEVYTLPKNVIVSRQELLLIFKDLNNTLRGEGLRAGIERLSEFANILFLKLLSENSEYDYWNSIKNQKDSDIIGFINGYVINDIQNKYGGDVITQLSIANPKTLREIIGRLDPLILSTIDTDIKGDAFEYFLQKTTSTENDLGEYFTPRHIVKTIIHLVNPIFKESIYDPFCGTGGFLTQAFKYIKENTILNTKQEEYLKKKTIFGGEITSTARIAKMNMILQGDGHAGVLKINSLANPRDKEFDIVISNIPFSQKTKYSGLYYNGIAKNNGDATCILHCLRALKNGGRMALIIPEGFLYRGHLSEVRKLLLNNAKLQSVISLPQGVFLPYAMTKTDILYFVEVGRRTDKHFFYFDVKNDGYSLDNHRRKIQGPNDLQIVNSAYFEDKKDTLSVGFNLIDLEKVKCNNYNLVGNQYAERRIKTRWPEVKLEEVILDIKDGGTPSRKKEEYFNGGIHWCIVKDIKPEIWKTKETISKLGLKNSSAKVWPVNSIIISLGASIGHVGIAKIPVATKQGLAGIVVNSKKIIPEYLFYILSNRTEEIQSLAMGTTIKEIRPSRFKKLFRLPLPPLKIQRQMIKELKREEKKIKKSEREIEKAQKNIKKKINSLWKI